MQTDLLAIKNIIKAIKIKNLLYFISDNRRYDEIFLKITNFTKKN